MAKGNALLGYSRGSVGDVTFSRVKGQQVSKARNRQPANPKTNKQVLQRASFINPVKFFTQGVQALFKFAYSDKKVTESDFNAFQRHNAKASFPVTKAEYDNPAFPPLGNYLMSKGKLPEVPISMVGKDTNNLGIVLSVGTDIDTIGDLSAALIKVYNVAEGDIVTLLQIYMKVEAISSTDLTVTSKSVPVWYLDQFIIDSSDTTPVSDVLSSWSMNEYDSISGLFNDASGEDSTNTLVSCACVVSRETALGLEVSTSRLHNGGYIDAYIANRKTDAEVGKVLADWGATGDAILQGAIAKK